MPAPKGFIPHNKLDRSGETYGKLTVIEKEGWNRWLCRCTCGNTVAVLSTNLANYRKNGRGCRHCAMRLDITGERVGLLVAVSMELGVVRGRPPIWTFLCDCGRTAQGEVKDFRFGRLRSCGCIGNAHSSWKSMMARCYTATNNRFKHSGGRGIRVCKRWHTFDNFLSDMGECPKNHGLSRLRCEEDYKPGNCVWEHITKNTADTCFGKPTKPGLAKGAVDRRMQA